MADAKQRRREALRELVRKTRAEFEAATDENYIAPYSPSPQPLVERAVAQLQLTPADVVYELGSGDARWLFAAHAASGGCRCVGVEIDDALVASSQAEARRRGVADRVQIRKQDIAEIDLRDATVVIVYAFAKSCQRIRDQLEAQVQPGTRVVSVGFKMQGWEPVWFSKVKGLPVRIYEVPRRAGAGAGPGGRGRVLLGLLAAGALSWSLLGGRG